jgi:hypothetical protein
MAGLLRPASAGLSFGAVSPRRYGRVFHMPDEPTKCRANARECLDLEAEVEDPQERAALGIGRQVDQACGRAGEAAQARAADNKKGPNK